MINNPLISIVLPTYNGQKYIGQSVRSCIEQTYDNWELIIVDDASTDNTPLIIQRFVESDSRIKSVRNEANQKLPASLNIGFSKANGRYLTWTSDDNYYHLDAISEMVNYLQMRPDIDIVYADYTLVDAAGNIGAPVHLPLPDNLAVVNPIGACFLYRRAVHERLGGYDTNLYTAEDYDYWLRASLYFKFYHLKKPLYYYRMHTSTITSRLPEVVRLTTEGTLKTNLAKMDWLSNEMRARGYAQLAGFAMRRGDPCVARRYISIAMRYCVVAAVQQLPLRVLLEIFLYPKSAAVFKKLNRLLPMRK